MSSPMQLTISSPLLVSLAECVHVFCSRGFAEVKVGLRAGASLGIVCPCVLKPLLWELKAELASRHLGFASMACF